MTYDHYSEYLKINFVNYTELPCRITWTLTCSLAWGISGKLFRLNHLPLSPAQQDDCEAQDISAVGRSYVEDKSANETEVK